MFEGSCKMEGGKGGSPTPTPLAAATPPDLKR
jgi:hypothetical protein